VSTDILRETKPPTLFFVEAAEAKDVPSLIDVRPPDAYEKEHLPNASTNIPFGQVADRIEQIPHDAVLICQSGQTSSFIAGLLSGKGRKVRVVKGGMNALK
jgi:rhodanese-related sulfurtransferase|tara:strand:- start:1853 stop:2155 length:303 start_codon:yes stop_codon:yes gene_type:complete